MTNPDQDVSTIQAVYAAFGAGDIPGVLAHLTPDVSFTFAGASAEVPWHGPWNGAAEIPAFFTALGGAVTFDAFEPLHFAAGAGAVAARVHLRYRVHATGKTIDEDHVHWWTLRDGKVSGLVHFSDTAQVIAACRA